MNDDILILSWDDNITALDTIEKVAKKRYFGRRRMSHRRPIPVGRINRHRGCYCDSCRRWAYRVAKQSKRLCNGILGDDKYGPVRVA